MKRRGAALLNLVFFIPTIILSFAVWNDYNRYINHIESYLPSLSGIYFMDQGNKVVGLSDKQDTTYKETYIFDAGTRNLINEMSVRSNIFGQMKDLSYQKDGVIIPTYDDSMGLQLNLFRPSGQVDELALGRLNVPDYLTSGVKAWRGRMVVTGETSGSALYVAQVKDEQFHVVLLNTDNLPARPVRVDEVPNSFDNDRAVPLFEVDLKDDRTAYVSGILDKNNKLLVFIPQGDMTPSEAQNHASAKFAKQLGFNNTKIVKVDGTYPKVAKFYNGAEREWGAVVPTPKPVYQSKVFLLNDQEVLIAGSTAKDELGGTVHGYVFNEKTGKFTDATGLLGLIPFDELQDSATHFYKELGSNMLYYQGGEKAAGFMNVKSHAVRALTTDQVNSWMVEKGTDQLSLKSFWNYVKQFNAVVINWLAWLIIPLFTFITLPLLSLLMKRSMKKKIASGVPLQGTIVRIEETGLIVNERPQVLFVVEIVDEGQRKEVEVKKVISYLTDVRVGDSVMISYNRKKNSAVFITDQDVQEVQEPEIIKNAVLSRIDLLGNVNRSKVLELHFTADGRDYMVPVVQPPGFEYQRGEKAELMMIQGTSRIRSYGNGGTLENSNQVSLNGEVIGMKEYSIYSSDRRSLMLVEVNITEGPVRIRKINSLFVPREISMQAGLIIPVSMRSDDFKKEAKLSKGKQGAAKVTSVRFTGTLGERPLATITVDRGGVAYFINQTIEPVYGVEVGDEVWIAYDESTREAMIINYSE